MTRLDYQGGTLDVGVDYLDTPAVIPGEKKSLRIHLSNTHPDTLSAHCALHLPATWKVEDSAPLSQHVDVPAASTIATDWQVSVPQPSRLENKNGNGNRTGL